MVVDVAVLVMPDASACIIRRSASEVCRGRRLEINHIRLVVLGDVAQALGKHSSSAEEALSAHKSSFEEYKACLFVGALDLAAQR